MKGATLSAEEILATFPPGVAPSFADLLTGLFQHKFRGRVLLHFDEGIPKVVEFPSPTQVTLAEGSPQQQRRGAERRRQEALTSPPAQAQATG